MKKTLTIAGLLLVAVTGTASAHEKYDVKIDGKSAKASKKAETTIHVTPKGGLHMNLDFPAKLTITAPDGVKVEKATVTKEDKALVKVDAKGGDFKVAFTADGPGKKSFTGVLKFAVCSDKDCMPQTENVSFDVDVK